MSALDDILAQLDGEARGWVVRNAEPIAHVSQDALRGALKAVAQGRTLDAETDLYRSLDAQQRRSYRAASIEDLKDAVDARLRATAIILDAIQTLSAVAAAAIDGVLDGLLGALASGIASAAGGSSSDDSRPAFGEDNLD